MRLAFTSKAVLWSAITAVLVVALYALIGFKLAPKLIRSQAMDYAKTELKKPLTLGEITVNPFTFELDMRDIMLSDADQPLLALKRLQVDFQAVSLFKRAFVFNAIALEKPFAHALIRPDGSLNLVDLLPKEKNNKPLPDIHIGVLSVNAGQIKFADHSRTLKPDKSLSPISFNLRDFKTRNDGGGFVLAADSDDKEHFEWRGSLALEPIASKGRFKVERFKAVSAYEFLSQELPFQLSNGTFSLSGDYDFAIKPKQPLRLVVTMPQVRAEELAIRPKSGTEDWIRIPQASLNKTRVDLSQRRASVETLNVKGLQAKAWMNVDGSLSIDQLFPVSDTAVSASAPASSQDDWSATIGSVTLSEALFDIEDRTVKPAGKFKLSPTAFKASGLSLDFDKPVSIQMTSTINGKAPLRIEGSAVPSAVTADLALELSGMPMDQLLMYLPDFPGIRFKSGMIGAKGRVLLDEKANIAYRGDGLLDDFVLFDIKNNTNLVALPRSTAQGIEYSQSPEKLRIASVTLEQPSMEVLITPEGTINMVDLLTTATTATAQSGGKQAVTETQMDIGKLTLRKGAMRFADYSMQPNFRANIEGMGGSLSGISTAPGSVATIDLKGYVINKYSPVEIKGKANLLAYDNATDLGMAFRNIELPVFNPYSGRFAGYAIAKGKLTTELHYRIDNRKLQADHRVIIDQLTWGQATDSKEAVSLPIRLGTALLKDKNGVIDLNVPVTGTLDDPKFRIGPIVWQVIKNLLVKAVSAPFKFIGGLFAGAEEAQYVDFEPGAAALSESAVRSLTVLAKALADKPELNLDIPAGVLLERDRAAIAERKFLAAVSQAGKPGKSTVAYADWEPKQQLAALEALYKQQFGKKPEIPKPEAAPANEAIEDAGWKEKRAAKKSAEVAWLETQLRPKFQASTAELDVLGQARGEAVQETLLKDGSLDPTRVFLSTKAPLTEHEGKVRMELALK